MSSLLDFCAAFARIILIILNVVLLLWAIGVIITGTIIEKHVEDVGDVEIKLHGLSYFTMGLGGFLIVVALFGCYAAFLKIPLMLTIYAIILIFLCVIQLVLGIMAFRTVAEMKDTVEEDTAKHLKTLYTGRPFHPAVDEHINDIHKDYACCGITGPNDPEVREATGIMKSCCEEDCTVCTVEKARKVGCSKVIRNHIESLETAVGVMAFCLIGVQVTCAVLAIYVRITIKSDNAPA